jgi:hypothetical protein
MIYTQKKEKTLLGDGSVTDRILMQFTRFPCVLSVTFGGLGFGLRLYYTCQWRDEFVDALYRDVVFDFVMMYTMFVCGYIASPIILDPF